jgi:hypothetical protein
MMSVDAMTRATKESPVKKTPHEQRVDLLSQSLARSNKGEANWGMLRLLLGMMNNEQLTLLEETVLALHEKQSRHEDLNKRFLYPSRFSTFADDADWGPFDHIVSSSVPEFDEIALIALRDFSTAHNNAKDLIRLCKIMNELDIPLTERNVSLQIFAMVETTQKRSTLVVFSHPYLTYPELIRAVYDHPEHLMELVDLQRTRGTVKAAAEVLGSSKAISEGAL